MSQATTQEFAERLGIAVEGNPHAPPSVHGRQAWLLEKLRKEAGLEFSANSVSRWFMGASRPRADNIREIARVLGVDEVWLNSGLTRKDRTATPEETGKAHGAVLFVAGLIEMNEGRVTFPGGEDKAIDLQVNLRKESFEVVVASVSEAEDTVSCHIKEPIGEARIVMVIRSPGPKRDAPSVSFDIYDLTGVDRQHFGGFSVVVLARSGDRIFTAPDGTTIKPLKDIADLA